MSATEDLGDLCDELSRAVRLCDLLCWIERARGVTESVVVAAGIDPAVDRGLKAQLVPYNNAAMEAIESDGLCDLIRSVRNIVLDVEQRGRELDDMQRRRGAPQ